MWVSNFLKSYVNPNLGVCVSVGRGERNFFRYWAKLRRGYFRFSGCYVCSVFYVCFVMPALRFLIVTE